MNHEELSALLSTADECLEKSEYSQAEELAMRAIRELSAPESSQQVPENHSLALCISGACCEKTSRHDEALKQYTEALTIAEGAQNPGLQARALNGMAMVQWRVNEHQHALNSSNKALEIAEQAGDKTQQTVALGTIGIVYDNLADYPKALEYCQKALAMAQELGNREGVARHTGNIGEAYRHLEDYPRALQYYQEASTMFEALGNRNGVAIAAGNMGIVYVNLQERRKGMEFFQRALRMYEEVGNRALASEVTMEIGALYADSVYEDYDLEKAEEYLQKAIRATEELGTKYYHSYKSLAEFYKRNKQWEQAHEYFEKYHRIKEDVQSDEAKRQAQNLEHQRQFAEQEKRRTVEQAVARAEMVATKNLLYKVLPASIADRLLAGEKDVADYLSNVSILFADIVGFTPISANMPAHIVVRFLNFVFSAFDSIIRENGCEKIKTIGDGYMAVAGAPLQCEDHAERLARAALAMQEDIRLPDDIRKFIAKGTVFNIRIGLHMGAAVGGIMGNERFVYDIYSDAVNIAARMESSGEPGKVHVSKEFAWHLESRQSMSGSEEFEFEECDDIEIKGKGMMRTYYLHAKPVQSPTNEVVP